MQLHAAQQDSQEYLRNTLIRAPRAKNVNTNLRSNPCSRYNSIPEQCLQHLQNLSGRTASDLNIESALISKENIGEPIVYILLEMEIQQGSDSS